MPVWISGSDFRAIGIRSGAFFAGKSKPAQRILANPPVSVRALVAGPFLIPHRVATAGEAAATRAAPQERRGEEEVVHNPNARPDPGRIFPGLNAGNRESTNFRRRSVEVPSLHLQVVL